MERINSTSLVEIKELAEFIALEYDSVVTPLEKIAENENLKIIYDNYGSSSFDGMTVFDNSEFFIHLNSEMGNFPNSHRGRFTLAHELGHYFIDTHRIGLINGILSSHPTLLNQNSISRIEKEADYFASCLLMPEKTLVKLVEKRDFSFKILEDISMTFNVSTIAAAIRFSQLGNHPIMIVYAENGIIKWKTCSDDFPYKLTLLEDDNIPENTVLGEYFKLKNVEDTRSTEEVYAIDWFRYVSKDDSERCFNEYCLPFENKAISIIWEE